MTRLFLKLSISIPCIFLFLALLTRALGNTQPPNPALRGFVEGCEDKPQPCWYGIVPGVTTKEAKNVFKNLGYDIDSLYEGAFEQIFAYSESKCNLRLLASQRSGTIVSPIEVKGKCLTLGDLFLFWGKPDYVAGWNIKENYLPLMAYRNAYRLLPFPMQYNRLSPYTFFQSILWNLDIGQNTRTDFLEWRGFIPIWKYCQLEFTLSDCQQSSVQQTVPPATFAPVKPNGGLTILATLPPG